MYKIVTFLKSILNSKETNINLSNLSSFFFWYFYLYFLFEFYKIYEKVLFSPRGLSL